MYRPPKQLSLSVACVSSGNVLEKGFLTARLPTSPTPLTAEASGNAKVAEKAWLSEALDSSSRELC